MRDRLPHRGDQLRRPRRHGRRSQGPDRARAWHLHSRNLRPRRGRRHERAASFVRAFRSDRLHYRTSQDADAGLDTPVAADNAARLYFSLRAFRRRYGPRELAQPRPRTSWRAAMNWRIRLTWWDKLLLVIIAVAAVIGLVRFAFGIGSIANINNAYPWG